PTLPVAAKGQIQVGVLVAADGSHPRHGCHPARGGLVFGGKILGVAKKLSLCILWDRLQRVIQMLEIEHSRNPSHYCPKVFPGEPPAGVFQLHQTRARARWRQPILPQGAQSRIGRIAVIRCGTHGCRLRRRRRLSPSSGRQCPL
ncbi:unnamed protein product, partial [Pylaiella littoralis]